MRLRQAGDEVWFVFFINARPPGGVHRLWARRRLSFTFLKVGEPIPLFADRFLRVNLPLGFVWRLFVRTGLTGLTQPVPQILRRAGHRAGPALPLLGAAGAGSDLHAVPGGQPGL